MTSCVLTGAVISGHTVDVRIAHGRIADVAGSIAPRRQEVTIPADGRWLHVGLHDHHLHLRSLAAAGGSLGVGPDQVGDGPAFRKIVQEYSARLPVGAWLRAVGYHDSVAGPLDRRALDAIVDDRPVRVQHRSGELWSLNSPATDRLRLTQSAPKGVERDADGVPTGRFWRLDSWLEGQWPAPGLTSLTELSRTAAAGGVTGWTDATPDRSDAEEAALVAAVEAGDILQRLHLLSGPLPARWTPDARGQATRGAMKILLDDADLPPFGDLVALIVRAHLDGRPVAVHCVTRVQTVLAVTALEAAGSNGSDRIEHGAIIPKEMLGQIRHLGLTVVTQPNFVSERGDRYLVDVDERELPDLWRAGSLLRSGIRVAIGTDAPFGDPDPWKAMRAAVDRSTPFGRVLGADEAVTPEEALRWCSGSSAIPWSPRLIAPGAPADLMLLDDPPHRAVLLGRPAIAATWVAGRLVHMNGLVPK